jgi:hypothetical protein
MFSLKLVMFEYYINVAVYPYVLKSRYVACCYCCPHDVAADDLLKQVSDMCHNIDL